MSLPDPSVVHQPEKLVLVETVGSVLWFFMDAFWMLNLVVPAKTMVLPTLAVNLLVFRYTKHSLSHYSVAGAMNSWLLMNIFWMIGDLDKDPRHLVVARVMFAVGMVLLILVVGREGTHPERLAKVLAHFRRLRI